MGILEIILEIIHTIADVVIIAGAIIGYVYYRKAKEALEIAKEEFGKLKEFIAKIKDGLTNNPISKMLGGF